MRKQTKLVAVLSTAALLAIGASMTSFAATGWAEEDGTWVYYNRDGERATESWKKSGNYWYYLDSDGEMAVDQLIEDGDNYYYVDVNGVMASNQWVAIENEDAGEDDEPDQNWYYFQANGKALKQGDSSTVSLKTVNGKKYAFDDEGKMLWGWVNESGEHQDDTEGEGFKTAEYYFGSSDDGAMTTGWLQIGVTYTESTEDAYKYIGAAFNDDEDQTRWFYFNSNGKKVQSTSETDTKDKTINGKKYAFDQYGAMTAEWSLDEGDLKKVAAYASGSTSSGSVNMKIASKSTIDGTVDIADVLTGNANDARYTRSWKYYNSVEDGARLSRGWFKVVSAEFINSSKYDDDEDAWYYADGSGNLYAGQFKTINGKKYAFRNDGRMLTGLKFVNSKEADNLVVYADDDSYRPFDNEDDFLEHAISYENEKTYCYYFGDDGAMRTNKTTISLDGDNYNFYFSKSGSTKGQGITDEKDGKLYQSGMLLSANSDDKYQVVQKINGNYQKIDTTEFIRELDVAIPNADDKYEIGHVSKKESDIKEAYVWADGTKAEDKAEYILVNTSGKIIDSKSKSKDGNDYVFVTDSNGIIVGVYVES